MAKDTWFVVVSYDIPDDKRRMRVFKAMKNFGRHVQYSVFECELKPRDWKRMVDKVMTLIKTDEDSVRLYYMCESCVPKIRVLGSDTLERVKDYYQV